MVNVKNRGCSESSVRSFAGECHRSFYVIFRKPSLTFQSSGNLICAAEHSPKRNFRGDTIANFSARVRIPMGGPQRAELMILTLDA